MASTYSTNLAIELIGTGDQAGSWGNTTNTNLGTLIEQAISGYVTQAVSTGTDTTITIPNGATGVARNMYIELTGTGGASTNLIVPANKKLYFIFNNTSSGQVTVKVSGQTGVSVPNKAKIILVSNGTDVVDATNYIGNISAASANITVLTSASATITNLLATTLTVSGGTANGVLYLNGSKVATSGSALTFDGTILTTARFNVTNTTNGATFSSSGGSGMRLYGSSGTNQWDIYLNSTNLRFSDNTGGGQLFVDTGAYFGGNVGIGTSSPSAKLHVATPSSGTGAIFRYTGGTRNPGLFITTDETTANVILTASGSTVSGQLLQLGAEGTSGVLNIGTSNVGIGTSSPAAKLEVYNPSVNGAFAANTTSTWRVAQVRNDQTGTSGSAAGIAFVGKDSTQPAGIVAINGNTTGGLVSLAFLTVDSNTIYERARITSGGRVGINATAPGARLSVYGEGTTTSTYSLEAANSSGNTRFIVTDGGESNFYKSDNGLSVRITSGGDLLVAKASASFTTAGAEMLANGQVNSAGTADFWNAYSTTGSAYRFYVTNAGTVFATNTTISAISDQRFKENVSDLDVGIDAVLALKPRKFDWKEGKGKDIKGDRGFIAQEFEQVFPDLVDEWRDPAPEGEEPYKSVRQDLIPVLVKAIQEQQAMIKSLEAKVAALESK